MNKSLQTESGKSQKLLAEKQSSVGQKQKYSLSDLLMQCSPKKLHEDPWRTIVPAGREKLL